METLNSRPELTSIIQKVATKNGINNFSIAEVVTNSKGEGFLGEIFLVKIRDEKTAKEMNVVVKTAFTSEIRTILPIRQLYENEVLFYTSWSKILKEFLEERGETLDFVPKCLATSLQDAQEVLVLENLREKGFQVFDKKKILDEDHVRLIFKIYGRYHAFSFALRDQKPEELGKVNFFNAFVGMMTEDFDESVKKSSKSMVEALIPGQDDEVIEEFRKYEEGMGKLYLETITDESDHPTLLHGDCWSNNMMFKYQAGSPVDIRLLDFQLCRMGSPVCDLSYFLYSGASEEIFDNLEEHLQVYHESLSKTLRKLGSDPEKLYPFKTLQEDWRKFSKFGMILASMIIKIKTTKQEDIIDLTDFNLEKDGEKKTFDDMKYDEKEFRRRIRGLLRHMHKINAL